MGWRNRNGSKHLRGGVSGQKDLGNPLQVLEFVLAAKFSPFFAFRFPVAVWTLQIVRTVLQRQVPVCESFLKFFANPRLPLSLILQETDFARQNFEEILGEFVVATQVLPLAL